MIKSVLHLFKKNKLKGFNVYLDYLDISSKIAFLFSFFRYRETLNK